jgi:hypothetical protein
LNAQFEKVIPSLLHALYGKLLNVTVDYSEVLRRIFGPKKDEVTGGVRKLHNEALHDLYSSPGMIRLIKSKNLRWAGEVARTEEKNAYRLLVEKPEGKRQVENQDVGGW